MQVKGILQEMQHAVYGHFGPKTLRT